MGIGCSKSDSSGSQTSPTRKTFSSPPPMTIDPNKKYTATIEMAKGNIVLELYAKEAPKTVNNFVFLAKQGYYDGVTFHRVIPGFMAQSGDPTGTGSGGPGYSFADEFSPNLTFDSPGVIGMANAGANTNGSQFFITYVPTPYLNGYDGDKLKNCGQPGVSCHAVFGKVTQGMDVLQNITPRDPATARFLGDKINKITIKEQ